MQKISVLTIFILGILIVGYATTDSVFATHLLQGPISVDVGDFFTINAEPMDESTIIVTGHAPRTAHEPIIIRVTSPNGILITVDQIPVDPNDNYMVEIKTSAESWKLNGAYEITASQGPSSNNNSVSTKVEVVDGLIAYFNLDYQIKSGYVTYIQAEPDSNSLIISIDTILYDEMPEIAKGVPRDGELTIVLPREVIDAKIADTDFDSEFVVLVDGVNTHFDETSASSVRTLSIPFPYGSSEIKILGSSVDPEYEITIVPEFGILAQLILLVSVASIIVLSIKGKFSISYPRQ